VRKIKAKKTLPMSEVLHKRIFDNIDPVAEAESNKRMDYIRSRVTNDVRVVGYPNDVDHKAKLEATINHYKT